MGRLRNDGRRPAARGADPRPGHRDAPAGDRRRRLGHRPDPAGVGRGLPHQVLHGRAAHPPGRSHRGHDARLHGARHPVRAVAAGPRDGDRQPGGPRPREPASLRTRPGAPAGGDDAPGREPGALGARGGRGGTAPRGRRGRPHARRRHGRRLYALGRQERAGPRGGLARAQGPGGVLSRASARARAHARSPSAAARGAGGLVRGHQERSSHGAAGDRGHRLSLRPLRARPGRRRARRRGDPRLVGAGALVPRRRRCA